MANHAEIYGGVPSNDEISSVVKEVVNKKFPMFSINFDSESSWEDRCKGTWAVIHNSEKNKEFYLGLVFWRSLYEGQSCIEFRHGHRYGILWWIEEEIRDELARRFNLKQTDDAIGEVKTNKQGHNTYKEYLDKVYEGRPLSGSILVQEKPMLPPDMACLLK